MAMPALATTVSLDSFSVIRNGPLFFIDTFSDGLPPPVGPNGQGRYSATGTLQELGGRVRMIAFDPQAGAVRCGGARFLAACERDTGRVGSRACCGARLPRYFPTRSGVPFRRATS
jgi:hypothetical protein